MNHTISVEELVDPQTKQQIINLDNFDVLLKTNDDKEQFRRLSGGDIQYFENKKISVNVIENTIVYGNVNDISNLEMILELPNVDADCESQTFQLVMSNKFPQIFCKLLKKHKTKIRTDKTFANAIRKFSWEAIDKESIFFISEHSDIGDKYDEIDHRAASSWKFAETLQLIYSVLSLGGFHFQKRNKNGKADFSSEIRTKLDDYHVKTNSRYLLSQTNPIKSTIKLGNDLVKMKEEYHQDKEEIEILISRCQKFMSTLVNLCEKDDEIDCFFCDENIKICENDSKNMAGLWQTLGADLTECITHPKVQTWLYKKWLGDKPNDWRNISWFKKSLNGAKNIFFFPVWSLRQVIAPKKEITPINCFINSVASHVFFLAVLFYAILDKKSLQELNAINQSDKISVAQYIIIIWLTAYSYVVITDIIFIRYSSYWRSWWTVYQIVMLCLFWIASCCFLLTELDIDIKSKKYLLIASDGCNSVAITMAFMKILQWFNLSHTLGPFIISFSKMVTVICQMLIIFSIVIFAFSFGMYNLYRHVQFPPQNPSDKIDDDKTFFNNYVNTLRMLFWALFGYGRANAVVIPSEGNSTVGDGLFAEYFIIVQIGYCMWGFFHITFVIVLLNMLIAIMTTSYEAVQQNCDVQWKVARTEIWLYYITRHSKVAPPFNLLMCIRNSIIAFYRLVKSFYCKHDEQNLVDHELTSTENERDDSSTNIETLTTSLVYRYKIKNWIENPPRNTTKYVLSRDPK